MGARILVRFLDHLTGNGPEVEVKTVWFCFLNTDFFHYGLDGLNVIIHPGFNTRSSLYYYDVLVQVIYNTTTTAQVQQWVQTAIDDHSWLVLEYHGVDNSGSQYSSTPADLTTECQFIHQSGIACKTMEKAVREIAPYLK